MTRTIIIPIINLCSRDEALDLISLRLIRIKYNNPVMAKIDVNQISKLSAIVCWNFYQSCFLSL